MIKDSDELVELRAKFKDYYNNNLMTKFANLEARRRKGLMDFIIMAVFIFIILPTAILIFSKHFVTTQAWESMINEGYISFELIVLLGVVIVALLNIPILKYKKSAKEEVMIPFTGFFGNFDYKHECSLEKDIINRTKLYDAMFFDMSDYYNQSKHAKNFFRYFKLGDGNYKDDFFCGTYKDVGITISEEHLTEEVRTQKGSYRKTVFKGIMILLDMNKNFKGQTVVKKDKGWFLNKFACPAQLKRVTLEDIEFEKMFEVFSDDQIEARYLLTTAFMERMIRLRNSFKSKKIEFSFFENKLLIAISTNKNMFEVSSVFISSTDYKHIEKIFDQFYSVFSVIDILKLNQHTRL